MFDKLALFQIASGLARHAADRQAVVARNVANADTPGFRAQDLAPFKPQLTGGLAMRVTRPGHLGAAAQSLAEARIIDVGGESSPNGNSVSLEDEMVRSAEVRQQHDLALAVYSAGLGILRASLGRR